MLFPSSANVAPKFFTSIALNKFLMTSIVSVFLSSFFSGNNCSYLSFKVLGIKAPF